MASSSETLSSPTHCNRLGFRTIVHSQKNGEVVSRIDRPNRETIIAPVVAEWMDQQVRVNATPAAAEDDIHSYRDHADVAMRRRTGRWRYRHRRLRVSGVGG